MPPLNSSLLNKLTQRVKHSKAVELYPKLSEAKIIAEVFIGPEVKQLINSIDLREMLSEVERTASVFRVYSQSVPGKAQSRELLRTC